MGDLFGDWPYEGYEPATPRETDSKTEWPVMKLRAAMNPPDGCCLDVDCLGSTRQGDHPAIKVCTECGQWWRKEDMFFLRPMQKSGREIECKNEGCGH